MSFVEKRAPRYTITDAEPPHTARELHARPGETPPLTFPLVQLEFEDSFKDISDIPGLPSHLIRWTTDRWSHPFDEGEIVQDILLRAKVARKHHDHIATLGVRVPDYTHIAIGSGPDEDSVALYTLVERLDVVSWHDQRLRSLPGISISELIDQKINQPMLQYYTWLSETRQGYRLEDLGIFTQFGLIENPQAEHGYDGCLLDIECHVSRVS